MGQLLPLIIRIVCSDFLAQTLDDIASWGVSFHIPWISTSYEKLSHLENNDLKE